MIITDNQMKRIFNEFSQQIEAKFYKKMPHDDWRKIKAAMEDGRMFILNLHGRAYLTLAETCDGKPRTMLSFSQYDKSFGDFLYDLFWDDKEQKMIPCTNDYLNKMFGTSISPSQNSNDIEKTERIQKNNEYIKIIDKAAEQNAEYIASPKDIQAALNIVKEATSTYYDRVKPVDFTASMETRSDQVTNTTVTLNGTTATATVGKALNKGEYNTCIGTAIDGYTITGPTTSAISLADNIEDTARKVFNEEWNKRKENDKMKFGNFDFGPIKDNDNIRMSPYGLAVKNVNGTYQAYDKNSDEIMDVDVFNFKADNMFFKMPVAIDAIKVGDVIVFNRRPCFVAGFSEQGDVIAIDISLGEKKTILPTKSPFGFNFITKVMSLFDNMMTAPSNENPLGNMWMFALLDNDNQSMKDILPMMLLMNGVNGNTSFNPLMFYFMSEKNDKDNDWLLPMLMMNNFSGKIN